MILKRELSTAVACVFMTDGGTSHRTLMDEIELRRIRKGEALDATAVLGLDPEQVRFLDFPDGKLASHHAAAVAKVTGLLDAMMPEEVYVPYRHDGTSDHEATYRIVIEALHNVRRPTRVLEYPVWFWNRWPWVALPLAARRETLTAAMDALGARLRHPLLGDFRSGVFVRNVLARKRQALEKHRSQMSVLRHGKPWPTLGDVSGGEFLKCFFHDFEVFRCSEVRGGVPCNCPRD
jgi:LmbE family N-acetylglucosaminyl deacetylase